MTVLMTAVAAHLLFTLSSARSSLSHLFLLLSSLIFVCSDRPTCVKGMREQVRERLRERKRRGNDGEAAVNMCEAEHSMHFAVINTV